MSAKKSTVLLAAVTILAIAVTTHVTYAQRERGGERGGFDPAQMQARMLEMYKGALDATDEEWTVIEPLVKNVIEARNAARAGGGRPGGMGPGGRGRRDEDGERGERGEDGPGMRRGGSEDMPEAAALRKVIEDPESSAADIQTGLAAYRAAREKAQKKLEAAQAKLREVLSVRQEAQLVLMGTLD